MSGAISFSERITEPLQCQTLSVLQVNVGRICNLSCKHCHLSCGPNRTEVMNQTIMKQVLAAAHSHPFRIVDITGGAPELNRQLPFLLHGLHDAGMTLQLRTNLVALCQRPDLITLFSNMNVRLVASMPCYLEENVRSQRGDGVYTKSVECLHALNQSGYGVEDHLPLTLVYNPGGPFLPGAQADLETMYRKELQKQHGIEFTHLHTITNMPLGRFKDELCSNGTCEAYMSMLRNAFNPDTVCGLMCRHQICVDWDGSLYDCDFNLALTKPVEHGMPNNIMHFDAERLFERTIVTDDHCFACTAGAGSSCGGSLT